MVLLKRAINLRRGFLQKKSRTSKKQDSKESGAVLVEFTLSISLLLLIFAGIFDLSYSIRRFNLALDAARHGLRTALSVTPIICPNPVECPATPAFAQLAARQYLSLAGETVEEWRIETGCPLVDYSDPDISPNGVGSGKITGIRFMTVNVAHRTGRACLFCFSQFFVSPNISLTYPLCRNENPNE